MASRTGKGLEPGRKGEGALGIWGVAGRGRELGAGAGSMDATSRTGRVPRFPYLGRWEWALLGTMVIAFFTRFVYLGDVPLFHDEAYYWVWERHIGVGNLELSFYDHPAGIAYLIYISTAVFGDTEFGIRAIFAIIGVVNVYLVYRLGRYLYDERTGVLAAFLLSVNAGHILFSRSAMNDVAATLMFTLIMFLFAKAVLERSDRYLLLTGFALGVGFLVKYTVVVIAIGFLFFALAYPKHRRFLMRRTTAYALVLAAVITLPFWVWNATNDWAGLVYQGGHASPFLGLLVGGDFFYNQLFSIFYYPFIFLVAIGVPLTVISIAGLMRVFEFRWRRETAALALGAFIGMLVTYAMQLLVLTFALELVFLYAVYLAYKGFTSEEDALVGLAALAFIAFFAFSAGRMMHWVFPAFGALTILGARWLPRAYSAVAINRKRLAAFACVTMLAVPWMGAYCVNTAVALGNMGDAPDPKSPFGPAWISTTEGTRALGLETAEWCERYPDAVVLVPNWVTYSPVDYYLFREGVDVEMYTWVWDYQIGTVWERDVEHMPDGLDRAIIPVYSSSFLGYPDEEEIMMFLVYSPQNPENNRWWGSNDQTLFARTGYDHFEVVSVGRIAYNYTFMWQGQSSVILPYFIAYGERTGAENVTLIYDGVRYTAPKEALTYEGPTGDDYLSIFDWEPVEEG